MSKLIVTFNRSSVRALLRRDECAVWDDRYLPDGSFSMIGGRGADNWILLGEAENKLILSVPPNHDLQSWAYTPDMGRIYTMAEDTDGDGDFEVARWPIILISSTYEYIQHVNVLGFQMAKFEGGEWRRAAIIEGIPYRADGDYSAYTPDKRPELWLKAFTDYKSSPPTYGPSHNELTFLMPLWNPSTFPVVSASARDIGGFLVDARVLA